MIGDGCWAPDFYTAGQTETLTSGATSSQTVQASTGSHFGVIIPSYPTTSCLSPPTGQSSNVDEGTATYITLIEQAVDPSAQFSPNTDPNIAV